MLYWLITFSKKLRKAKHASDRKRKGKKLQRKRDRDRERKREMKAKKKEINQKDRQLNRDEKG
jgi:hypothetical protein